MAVFNCSTSEIEENVEFTVTTETNDQDTGELSVTDSLTIMGDQGVSVAVEDDAVKISIDPETFPEELLGGDTTELEQKVETIENTISGHGDSISDLQRDLGTLEQTVENLPTGGDTTELEQRVAEIEKDHTNNTSAVNYLMGLAENPENDGKVYGIKDEEIIPMDLPDSIEINEVSSPDEITADKPDGLYIVEGDAENGTGGGTSELAQTVAEHTTQIAGLRETVDDLEDDFIVVRDKVAALEENGTSGGVKIIDLNGAQYALSDTTTLGAYILSMCLLATDGGHVFDLTEEYPTLIDTILQECDNNQRVMFKSGGTLSNSAISLECALRDKVYIDGALICVGFSGEVYYGGAILRYSIIFDRSSGFLLTKETLAPTT